MCRQSGESFQISEFCHSRVALRISYVHQNFWGIWMVKGISAWQVRSCILIPGSNVPSVILVALLFVILIPYATQSQDQLCHPSEHCKRVLTPITIKTAKGRGKGRNSEYHDTKKKLWQSMTSQNSWALLEESILNSCNSNVVWKT